MSTAVLTDATIRRVEVTDETITAYLADGRVISVPLVWSWRLSDATPAQRANWELIGDGIGVHWPDVDEDISAEGMLSGVPAPRPGEQQKQSTPPANQALPPPGRASRGVTARKPSRAARGRTPAREPAQSRLALSGAFNPTAHGALARDGYTIVDAAVDTRAIDALVHELQPISEALSGVRGGARNLLRTVPAVRDLARSAALRAVAEQSLGPGALAVRAILFDKTPGANWKVVWHQDLTIAVRERRDVEGFGPWTEKEGVPHVQPPVEVLERMVAVRLHLDDCTERNGPVRVLPGSHRSGRLTSTEIALQRSTVPEVVCTVPRGGVLAFHSLLLHASSPALEPAHRRVVHVEYVGAEWRTLPGGLAWHDAV